MSATGGDEVIVGERVARPLGSPIFTLCLSIVSTGSTASTVSRDSSAPARAVVSRFSSPRGVELVALRESQPTDPVEFASSRMPARRNWRTGGMVLGGGRAVERVPGRGGGKDLALPRGEGGLNVYESNIGDHEWCFSHCCAGF